MCLIEVDFFSVDFFFWSLFGIGTLCLGSECVLLNAIVEMLVVVERNVLEEFPCVFEDWCFHTTNHAESGCLVRAVLFS